MENKPVKEEHVPLIYNEQMDVQTHRSKML